MTDEQRQRMAAKAVSSLSERMAAFQAELFPLKDAWPVTGEHTDGSPCYHTESDCKEHGSCIDCDACKNRM